MSWEPYLCLTTNQAKGRKGPIQQLRQEGHLIQQSLEFQTRYVVYS